MYKLGPDEKEDNCMSTQLHMMDEQVQCNKKKVALYLLFYTEL